MDILDKAEPKKVTLADGKEYILPVMNMGNIIKIEKLAGIPSKDIKTKIETEQIATLFAYIFAVLKVNYPDMTQDKAGELVSLKELPYFMEFITIMLAPSLKE